MCFHPISVSVLDKKQHMVQLSMWKCNKQNAGNTEEESIRYVWDCEGFFKEGDIWAGPWSLIIFFLEKNFGVKYLR